MVGAAAGAAVAHHRSSNEAEQQPEEQPQYAPAPAQYAPAPATATDQLEHLAELHSSGALSDEEFASAKAKVLGT